MKKKSTLVPVGLAVLAALAFGQDIENVGPQKALAYKRAAQDVCPLKPVVIEKAWIERRDLP